MNVGEHTVEEKELRPDMNVGEHTVEELKR